MRFVYTNNATVLIDATVSPGDATISLPTNTGALFPAPGVNEQFAFVLENRRAGTREILYCTSRTGDLLGGLVRGAEGTSPASWGIGSTLSHRMTSAALDGFYVELDALLGQVDSLYVRLDGANPMTDNLTIGKNIEPSLIFDAGSQPAGQELWVLANADKHMVIAPQSLAGVASGTGGVVFYRDTGGLLDVEFVPGANWDDLVFTPGSVVTQDRGDKRYMNFDIADNELTVDIKMMGLNQILGSASDQSTPLVPSLSFLGDADTGFYTTAEGIIGVSLDGVLRYRFEVVGGSDTNNLSVLTKGNADQLFGIKVETQNAAIVPGGTNIIFTHTLGQLPDTWEMYLECTNNNGLVGFQVGDYVPIASFFDASGNPAMATRAKANQIAVHYSVTTEWKVIDSTGSIISAAGNDLVETRWQWRMVASLRNSTP